MSATAKRRGPAVSVSCLLAFCVAACTQMVETVPLEPVAYAPQPTCHSSFGAYFLPRALLHVKATAGDTSTTLGADTIDTGLTVVADRRQPFCLDYILNPNSEDLVAVQRDEKGLLTSISTSAVDKTPQIAASLIETAEDLTLAARSGALASGPPPDFADLEFDPFNWDELMAAKKALARFGYCVYVEGYSFDLRSRDPVQQLADGRAWCNSSRPLPPARSTDEFASPPVPVAVMESGVLYRPNMSFKVVILRRADPGSRDPWTLYQTRRVDMPNISPVLSIGVERATFSTRKTTLLFNKGVLTDVAIDKRSEMVGFVQIPLALAKAIVDVPGQLVTLRITDANNQTALLAAQSQLLQAIATYKATVASNGGQTPRTATFTERRSAELFGACQGAGGGPSCNTWSPQGVKQ